MTTSGENTEEWLVCAELILMGKAGYAVLAEATFANQFAESLR